MSMNIRWPGCVAHFSVLCGNGFADVFAVRHPTHISNFPVSYIFACLDSVRIVLLH